MEDHMPDVRAKVREVPPPQIRERRERLDEEARSLEEWEKFTDQKREVTLTVVRETLRKLDERAEDWVPYALEIKQGNAMDVSFSMLFVDLEAELPPRKP